MALLPAAFSTTSYHGEQHMVEAACSNIADATRGSAKKPAQEQLISTQRLYRQHSCRQIRPADANGGEWDPKQ
jgi:hypothetical protein